MAMLVALRHTRWPHVLSKQMRVAMSSSSSSPKSSSLVLTSTDESSGISTVCLNDPGRLNAFSMPMMKALRNCFASLASSSKSRVVILTGTDPYYCSGVQLSSLVRVQHPATLHAQLAKFNAEFMALFLHFPKPLVIAMNGPAIGAAVTTSALADLLVVSEKATLSTPFGRLGILPEGCSSINFPRLIGREKARRMLREDWVPNAHQAVQMGLANEVVEHDQLLLRANQLALTLVDQPKWHQAHSGLLHKLDEANRKESLWLADAALSKPFLLEQQRFVARKGKNKKLAWALYLLAMTRPIWATLLPKQTPVHLDF